VRDSLKIYYLFYKKEYSGKSKESEISMYFNRAESYITDITLGKSNKIKKDDSEYSPIMFCVCEIADILRDYDNGDLLKSESVGGDRYEKVAQGDTLNEIIYNICRRRLLSTGLLYRGVN
jgi:hypothetical protein